MLARNAEALYWIGRYVERADDTARILDVTVHQLLEDSSVDPDQTSRMLLQVLGIEPPKHQLDLWSLTASDGLEGYIQDRIGRAPLVGRAARKPSRFGGSIGRRASISHIRSAVMQAAVRDVRDMRK